MARTGHHLGRGHRHGRGVLLLGLAVLGALTGCSGAGDITCQEYGQPSSADQDTALTDLLSEHELSVTSVSNAAGEVQDITAFCGTPGMGIWTTKNQDRPVDDAVDWDAENW